MKIKNGLVFTGDHIFTPATVTTAEDLITEVTPVTGAETNNDTDGEVFDAAGCYVLPGLTDVHFHGCDGHDFCDGTSEAYDAIAAYELTQGVTTICPATMTLSAERLSEICRAAAEYRRAQEDGTARKDTADLVGIHMEGPFISPAKKGAQNGEFIQAPSAELVKKWHAESDGLVRLVSLAPEMPGACECIKECIGDGIRFSIAHTQANYDEATAALQAGADHATHLYNAMPAFTHRAPGVIGAAFDAPNCFAELICDGVHINPSVVRATFKLFGADRMILISDSMEATGKPDGDYELGGQAVHVSGSYATLADGTLAGSATPLYRCMLTAVSMGIPLEDAITAATINPCRSIGIDDQYGSIEQGKKAHFLILDKETLAIKAVIKGQERY